MKKLFPIFGIILGSFLISACGSEQAESKNMEQIYKEEGIPVKTITVEPGLFEQKLNFNAVLSGLEESSAFASIGDRIERIYVNVGDFVKKDQVILSFPTDNPTAQYHQARVAFDNARTAHERILNLYKSGGISKQNLDNSQAGFDVAEANWNAVRQFVKVKAPISGYVTKINVRESENVNVEDELFTISKTKKMKAKIWISEKEIQMVKAGITAEARWNGNSIYGKLVQVDMAMNPRMQAFGAVVEFDNPDNLFRCGLTAEIFITTYRNDSTVVIERKNIINDSDRLFVFVVRNGKAEQRTVKTGNIQGLDVQISDGLQTGDMLVVQGQMLLDEGSKVKIVN